MHFQVTFDAGEPEKLARFWAVALGYTDDLRYLASAPSL
jgi:hypothetical protein